MALYSKVSGATEHPIEMHEFLANTTITTSGTTDAASFEVTERAVPTLGVTVTTGRAWLVKSDNSLVYPVRNDTDISDATTNITSNGAGNPRIDAVVLFYDEGAGAPATDGTGVATLQVVAGVAAASPTVPDDTAITTDIGGAFPYIVLAEVAVASGATTISNGDITDVRTIAEQTALPSTIIDDGWNEFTGTLPTYITTFADFVDQIQFIGVDITGDIQVGEWVRISSGAGSGLIYKVTAVGMTGSDTYVNMVGEVSPSGTITAISFSKGRAPQGATPWEMQFKFRAERSVDKTLPDNVVTPIQCNSEVFDTNSNYNTGTFKWTCPVTAYYLVRYALFINDAGYKLIYTAGQVAFDGVIDARLTTHQLPTQAYNGRYSTLVNSKVVKINRGVEMDLYGFADVSDAGACVAEELATNYGANFISV